MRKKLFTFLLTIVASIGMMFAESGTCGENLTWDLTDGVLTISGTGAMNNYSFVDRAPWYSKKTTIKSIVIAEGVASIGAYAFYTCDSLTSVMMSNSVTEIGHGAFQGCSGIISPVYNAHFFVRMPKSFSGAYVIPDGIETICHDAFTYCTGLTSIVIPNSVKSIGAYAFYSCSSLTSVEIPNSVTEIGDAAFEGCSSIISPVYNAHFFVRMPKSFSGAYVIPDGIETIFDDAFSHCTGLTSIVIPNSVKSIGGWAFSYCFSLVSVTIGQGVATIGNDAFYKCDRIESVVWNARNCADFSHPNHSPFYDQYSDSNRLQILVLGDEVEHIPAYLCYGMSALKSIILPNSIISIGEGAFGRCRNLTSVTIPNGVTSIGESAFSDCSSLTSVTIPNSVTSIGGSAFYDVPNIIYNGSATGSPWGARSVNGYVDGFLVYADGSKTTLQACSTAAEGIIVIPNSVTNINERAFSGCSSLTSVTIPNSVTSIGYMAFYNCSGLTSITIPNSVTSIGESAFSGCRGLTSVTIPNSVTSIGNRAFYNCSSLPVIDNLRYADTYLVEAVDKTLSNYTIQEGTRWIGNEAFYNCSSLKSIEIPNSVINIGSSNTFYGCSNLTFVVWNVKNYPDFSSYGSSPFSSSNTRTNIVSFVFGDEVEYIPAYLCYGMTSLSSVSIPKNVTSIGDYAFQNCTNLHTIYALATTPPSISNRTFKDGDKNAIVYTALGCYSAYKTASVWKYMNIQHPYQINVTSSTATSATIIFEELGVNIASVGIEGGEQVAGNTLEYIGLEPNSEYTDVPIVLTANTGETETVNVSFTTSALELTTKPSKVVSSTTAILLAETNMSDAEVSCGFEYKRNDAPADMDGTKVYCPVASGQMAGRLKNLKDDVYYKYRAFYQSAAGNMYYGDWQYIFTGDVAVEFDPILYTYGATVVRENEATISGYALAGSEDFTEQGFEYWAESRANGGTNAPRRMPAALNEHFYVQASGISLRVTLTNLDAGTVYKYRVYGKVGDQYYYGSEQAFTTAGTYTPPTYTIIFVNWDGTELQSSQVKEGEMPVYSGATPERPEDEQYIYTFNGWSPAIVAATADATYTAAYKQTLRTYTVTFVDWDGTELQSSQVLHGELPVYTGEEPEREEDAEYIYTFVGWTPDIVAAHANALYTATYESTLKSEAIDEVPSDHTSAAKLLRNGQIYILRGERVYTITGAEIK